MMTWQSNYNNIDNLEHDAGQKEEEMQLWRPHDGSEPIDCFLHGTDAARSKIRPILLSEGDGPTSSPSD
jgi:hypothetical protein